MLIQLVIRYPYRFQIKHENLNKFQLLSFNLETGRIIYGAKLKMIVQNHSLDNSEFCLWQSYYKLLLYSGKI